MDDGTTKGRRNFTNLYHILTYYIDLSKKYLAVKDEIVRKREKI